MLVLSRLREEEIVIGEGEDAIVVKILGISRGRVKIGITARRGISVHRKEVWIKINRGSDASS